MTKMITKFMQFLADLFNWADQEQSLQPQIAPVSPVVPITPPSMPPNPDVLVPWTDQKSYYHNARVICDLAGLSVDEKNLICACIYQESEFLNTAKCENKDSSGKVWSTDWGICQINDWYHIGAKKDFPSVQYVLDNPDKVIEFMVSMYRHGLLKQWVSYSSGAYKKWLSPGSPMWKLKT